MPLTRDYDALGAMTFDGCARDEAMRRVVDGIWRSFEDAGVSWTGFYLGPGETVPEGGIAGPDEMLLAVREPKPACSPIGLHGACGQSFRRRSVLIVNDVAALGDGYVACDPRDAAEVVIPHLDDRGECFGVLDLDSFSRSAFTEHDARSLHALLVRAGLTAGAFPPVEVFG